ncbi:MAG: hypothetical protein GXP31_16875 [Kiritimatiellaeota bacterium]|nr:hypothetical protein [Kiritimatiellota bacterium]
MGSAFWTAILVLTASFVPLFPGHAAEYYFDSEAGADDNPGVSPERPFRSLEKLARLSLQPGDAVRFKCGSTVRGQLRFKGSGTRERPITVGAYGPGPKPTLLGSVRPTEWEHVRGELYRTRIPTRLFVGDRAVYGVFDSPPGKIPTRLEGSRFDSSPPSQRNRFYFDDKNQLLYVITPSGRPPEKHHIEASVVTPIIDLAGQSWIVIEDLTLLFGNRMHISIRDCHDVIVRHCASLFVAFFGNPNITITRGSSRIRILDSFLYENCNCGIVLTDGATQCVVRGCTIVKGRSNDGVTCHSGPRGKDGLPTHLAGDFNLIENNVIGLWPENSIDITSGDHHVVRGNICYSDRQSNIITGHGADHILIENNICFGSMRAGIMITENPKEGARGENRVIRNLVFDNQYPGLEIQARNTRVFNNTVVNSFRRPAVRINAHGRGSVLRNNLIAMLDREIPHPCLHFLRGTPTAFQVALSHNMFYHRADQLKPGIFFPAGRVIGTDDGRFTPEAFAARYGTGGASFAAEPGFDPKTPRYYLLTPKSPAVDSGVDVGLPFVGKAPDVGWKELGNAKDAPPRYPKVLIDGDGDDTAVLALWSDQQNRR